MSKIPADSVPSDLDLQSMLDTLGSLEVFCPIAPNSQSVLLKNLLGDGCSARNNSGCYTEFKREYNLGQVYSGDKGS